MRTLRFVLGDQLSHHLSALNDLDPDHDLVLMVEARAETTHVPHHKQKIVLVLSAMRHFADTLRDAGVAVDYVRLDDPHNTGFFSSELQRALTRHNVDRIVMTEPGEWWVWNMITDWRDEAGIPFTIRPDDRFLCSKDEFRQWAKNRKSLRNEYFYRMMRKKTGWLMNGDQPEGGKWNYDQQNRKALPDSVPIPTGVWFSPDEITQAIIQTVRERYGDHFGELGTFKWGVTRAEALQVLDDFLLTRLPYFGDYQDAIKLDAPYLFHSTLSPYLNLGLLTAREVCETALKAYQTGNIPLSSIEGFLRQILGWREFVRGVYWLKMPEYAQTNALNAHRPLPAFYWTGKTALHCLQAVIRDTSSNAYAHHIQRLMVTGNFALLTGISPVEVERWYRAVYADAYDWVELPNTHGMALFADGGVMASKPYAASGAYIHRMSDYCESCTFDPTLKVGEHACPFNYLYWYFLWVNKPSLQSNPRMALSYHNLGKMGEDKLEGMITQAEAFLQSLDG